MMNEELALVIEDDSDAAHIFSKALEVIGFKTEIIRTGDRAISRLNATTPDIVLLDLHLPHIAGSDILNYIRSDVRFEKTRVIVATADPRMAESLREKPDLVLIKPTTFSQVRDLAARLTRSHSAKTRPINIEAADIG